MIDPIILLGAAIGLGLYKKYHITIKVKASRKIASIKEKRAREKELNELLKMNTPEYQARADEALKALKSTRAYRMYTFTDFKRTYTKELKFRRKGGFEEGKDILIHGRLLTVQKDGTVKSEDIFCYQPQLYSENDIYLGPVLTEDGKVRKNATYVVNIDGEKLMGYAPKREIETDEMMEFDIRSKHSVMERFPMLKGKDEEHIRVQKKMHEFIQVEYDMDADGNYIPYDLSNPEKRKIYEKYRAEHAAKNSFSYFKAKILAAKHMAEERLQKEKEEFRALQAEIDAEEERIQQAQDKAKQMQVKKAKKVEKTEELREKFERDLYDANRYDIQRIGSRGYNMQQRRNQGMPPQGMPGQMGPMGGMDDFDHDHDHEHEHHHHM